MKNSLIGERMVNSGFLTQKELNYCLKLQSENGNLLGVIAIKNRYITEDQLAKVLTTEEA